MASKVWLIWSNEHQAYWKQDHCGYTNDIKQAGLYTLEEGINICFNASLGSSAEIPNETMFPSNQIYSDWGLI